MINRFDDYDKVQVYGDYERLPKGGYVLKVMGASIEYYNGQQTVKLSCDVAEGEYANFFADSYRNNTNENKKWSCNYLLNVPANDGSERDAWTKKSFKTVIAAFEDSNPGYHFDWNETKFKGLLIGGLFNYREYIGKEDGNVHEAVNLARLVSVDKIRSGSYKVPEDKKLKQAINPGFMSIPESANDSGLPFN